ncbi:MAG: hypothetical protein ABJ239_09425 [Erythrobacter sp.]
MASIWERARPSGKMRSCVVVTLLPVAASMLLAVPGWRAIAQRWVLAGQGWSAGASPV